MDALESLDATINTLKYLRVNEDDINRQIDAVIALSVQRGIDAQSEFAKNHRRRVVPQRVDDAPETAINLDFTSFHRKEFLQVLDAQISLLDENLKMALKIIEPAISLLKPPYESEMVTRDVSSYFVLTFSDKCQTRRGPNVFRSHCSISKPNIASIPLIIVWNTKIFFH